MAQKRKTKKADYQYLTWADAPDFLSISQAARVLGFHNNTLAAWVKDGKLKSRFVGGRHRILKVDLANYVGVTLNPDGTIRSDDGRLLAHYAKRFDEAIAQLCKNYSAQALTEIQEISDEMKKEVK